MCSSCSSSYHIITASQECERSCLETTSFSDRKCWLRLVFQHIMACSSGCVGCWVSGVSATAILCTTECPGRGKRNAADHLQHTLAAVCSLIYAYAHDIRLTYLLDQPPAQIGRKTGLASQCKRSSVPVLHATARLFGTSRPLSPCRLR